MDIVNTLIIQSTLDLSTIHIIGEAHVLSSGAYLPVFLLDQAKPCCC
jgi:hypothetical protein